MTAFNDVVLLSRIPSCQDNTCVFVDTHHAVNVHGRIAGEGLCTVSLLQALLQKAGHSCRCTACSAKPQWLSVQTSLQHGCNDADTGSADGSLQSSDFTVKTQHLLPVFQHGLSAFDRVHASQIAAESQFSPNPKNSKGQFDKARTRQVG